MAGQTRKFIKTCTHSLSFRLSELDAPVLELPISLFSFHGYDNLGTSFT